jgi:hypothetical protein
MSEIGAAPKSHDTHLMPVLFRDGADRRRSARIPLSTAVRIGPPHGTPYALVSASDLSTGGLFIDADRPVRVGARFSAEIELSHVKIYIPEAEVAYNRDRHDGAGFGVRFVEAEEDALKAVAEEIGRVTDQTLVVRSKGRISDLPTLPPVDRPSVMGVEFSHYPEPEIIDESLDACSVIEASAIDRVQAGLRETRQRFIERAKSAPAVFRMLAIAGSIGLVASAAFAVAHGADGGAVAHDPSEHGVAASTHQVLMGKQDVATLDKPAAAPAVDLSAIEDPKLRRKMLPPLVVLEEERIEGTIPKSQEKPIAKPAGIAKPSDAASVRVVGIDPGARVLKTHVFRSPDRFVIDLTGQQSPLALPAGVRAGRHPDFYRVVVDAPRRIEAGRARIEGRTLAVTLE